MAPVYKLEKRPGATIFSTELNEAALGEGPTTPAECVVLLDTASRMKKLADKTIAKCKVYAEQSGERILRADGKEWGQNPAVTVQRYSATIDEAVALIVRCGGSATLAKRIEAELIELGVGSERTTLRWEWRK